MMLVLPLLFVFILVVVDLGVALDRREMVQHSIREGARAAAIGDKSIAEIRNIAVDQSGGLFDPGSIQVCYVDRDGNGTTGNAGDAVRVSGSYTYNYIVGNGWLPIPGVRMTPSAEARLETAVTGAVRC
jgi:hypothetical protein